MSRFIAKSLFLVLIACSMFAAHSSQAAESALKSTMRNVNAVAQTKGYYITPAPDKSGAQPDGVLAPIQAFELIRPGMGPITISRLYTSCTCVNLISPQRSFAKGERAILELHNVRATPINGQIYAIYIQVSGAVRATLRYDTFVQSSQFVIKPLDESDPRLADAKIIDPEINPSILEEVKEDAEAAVETVEIAIEVSTETEQPAESATPVIAAADDAGTATATTPVSTGDVDQRISIITLGVTDLTRSRSFYEALGWKSVGKSKYDSIVFFQLNGQVLALYPLSDLLSDQKRVGHDPRPGGVSLGINVKSKEQVQSTYQTFLAAGGLSLKEPEEMPWGSVTSYVADPDGHAWEISWVPQMQIDDKGQLWIQ